MNIRRLKRITGFTLVAALAISVFGTFHNGEIISPTGDSVIKDRDSVIVVTTLTGLKDISDILES